MNSQQQRIFSSPRSWFFHCREFDFFSSPRSRFFHRRDIDFSSPHGNNQFFLRLTAISISSLPHGKNQFLSAWRGFTPHGDIDFSLPHGKNRFLSAWRWFTPHGDINFSLPHGKNRFHLPDGNSRLTAISTFLCLMARIDFICLTAIHTSRRYQFFFASRQELVSSAWRRFTPHGDINFLFASRGLSIFLCLSARIDFIPPYGNSRLTAIINFSLPLGKNQSHSALWQFTPHSDNQFFFASRQESISFRLTAIRATRRYQFFLCLTAIIDFFFAPRKVLLITHQGILWEAFFSFLVHPFWCSQSRLQVIGAGVAFLATPGDEQPLRPLWRSLNRMTGHALALDNPIENSVDTVISEGRLLSWYTWISTINLII